MSASSVKDNADKTFDGLSNWIQLSGHSGKVSRIFICIYFSKETYINDMFCQGTVLFSLKSLDNIV